jgi:hypothetical protein
MGSLIGERGAVSSLKPICRFVQPALGVTAIAVISFSVVACGSSGASQEELNQAKQEGAAHAQETARIKQIQREIRAIRRHGGGNPNVVPAGTAPSSATGGTTGTTSCGGELSVGPSTTCPFAENVRAAYEEELGTGSGIVYAYSPVTKKLYEMLCTAGTPHVCTGGNDASVYFP